MPPGRVGAAALRPPTAQVNGGSAPVNGLASLFVSTDTQPTPAPKFSPLQSGGTVDDHILAVYGFVFWVSVAVGIFVVAMLLYSFVHFRRRSDDDEPKQVHGSNRLEWTWTLTPFAILMVVFVISALNMNYIKEAPTAAADGSKPLQITVIGEQFSWTYDYTGQHNTKGRDVQVGTVLTVPANQPVELHVVSSDATVLDAQMNNVPSGCATIPDSSGSAPARDLQSRIDALKAKYQRDPNNNPGEALWLATAIAGQGCGVNHSFYLGSLGDQVNAIPGQVNYLWFDAQPGTYLGQCTELCGSGHDKMLIEVHALSQADYQTWLQQQMSK